MKKAALFSEYLKDKRVAAGLSQADVSDKLGYSTPQFISNWERGVSTPPINILKKIADLYKINADEMFEYLLQAKIVEISDDLKKKFKAAK